LRYFHWVIRIGSAFGAILRDASLDPIFGWKLQLFCS
jgi:hypothetical protein